jgi:hypothetical protein
VVTGARLVPARVRTVGCLLLTGTCAVQAQSGGMADVNLNKTSGAGSSLTLLLATEVHA